MHKLDQQFYFKAPHHSEYTVGVDAELVLSSYLVIRVVFGDAGPSLVLFCDDVVENG